MSGIGKSIKIESKLVVAKGWRDWWGNREWLLMSTGLLFGVIKMFKNCLWWWLHKSEYTKHHWTVHFKRVNCIVCELYLNKAVIKQIYTGGWFSPCLWESTTLSHPNDIRLGHVTALADEMWVEMMHYTSSKQKL